jgi:FixJ family two-component response regulator
MTTTRNIAIVDDDARVLESLANLLASCGYRSELFTSAEDLLASGGLSRFCCVITDREMPRMSGLDLLAQIKRVEPSLRVILITGKSSEETEAFYASQGAAGFLRKPLDGDRLFSLLEQFC